MTSPDDPRSNLSPVAWSADGVPRSRLYDDVYFSTADGLAETRAVFLSGCGLPEAWAGRTCFTVGELGFGSGLNVVALLDLWRRTRPEGGQLSIFSVEAHPMPAVDARRILAAWPEVAAVAEALLSRWPRAARGFHRVALPEFGARLDLAVMDVAEALAAWDGAADAWFLDGFSPAQNPAMWSAPVLAQLAARSAPGARAATFTVAGQVRRDLAAAGFSVAKAPGFGRKRERLEARLAGQAPEPPRRGRVAVIGAGIAGAALARAFRALGVEASVFEAEAAGAGASGNPAALAAPRLDAGGGPIAALFAQAEARAADLYGETPEVILARGLAQAEAGPKDASRFDRIAEQPLFTPGAVRRLGAEALSQALGEPSAVGGLALAEALVVRPEAILSAWLGEGVRAARIAHIERDGEGWVLRDAAGAAADRVDVVCLAAGLACRDLHPGAPLAPVRGQVGWVRTDERPAPAIGGGYVIPTADGLLFGATHDRDEASTAADEADTSRNLDLLARLRPALAERVRGLAVQARAGVRAVTPDFLPLAGALGPPGLFILSGLGSRGFCAAPLLAEHVAAQALDLPSPLPRPLADLVDPRRFAARRQRRGRPASTGESA